MRVLFFSKAKRTTQATEHMMTALRRHPEVTAARHISYSRMKRFLGLSWAEKVIRARIKRFQPDITLINSMDIRPEWLDLCKSYGVTLCVFLDYCEPAPARLVDIGRQVDFLYVSSEKQVPELKEVGVKRVRMLLRGCSRDNHYPVAAPARSKWRSDVAFIGKPRDSARIGLLHAVAGHCDFKLWGRGWDSVGLKSRQNRVCAADYRKICASSKIMLGINDGCPGKTMETVAFLTKYTSDRTNITLACGGFHLTNYNNRLEELFKPGVHLDFYTSIEDCLAKIDYYLAHPEERERISKAGSAYVRANMTFDHFVDEVVRDACSLA